jgi:hypothetical protein
MNTAVSTYDVLALVYIFFLPLETGRGVELVVACEVILFSTLCRLADSACFSFGLR